MSAFQSLRELVWSLNPDEMEVCRNYLGAFRNGGDIKNLKLLDIIAARPNRDMAEHEIMFLCYGGSNQAAFDRLVLRLRDKVLESLLLDVNIERKGAYGDRWKVMTSIRKKINAAQILSGRGLIKQSLFLYESAIKDAREFEFYDEMLLAFRYQLQDGVIQKGEKEFYRIYDQIKQYSIIRDSVERAYLIYAEYTLRNHYKSGIPSDNEWLQRSLEQLEKDYKITGSATIGYFLQIIRYGIYSQTGDLKKSRLNMLSLIDLLNKSNAIKTDARLGINLTRLAEIELQHENFDEAIGYACKGFDLMPKKKVNQLLCLEIIGLASFYQEDYVTAQSIIQQCIRTGEELDDNEQRTGRRKLIMSWIHFMQGDYKICLNMVMQENPIEKDSEGWHVGLRILRIMCLCEMLFEDTAVQHIENLRHHIMRLKKEVEVHERAGIILHLFQALEKNGFQFKNLLPRIKDMISKLESDEQRLKWIPYTWELMPVHRWFIYKIFKQPFSLERSRSRKGQKGIKKILFRITDTDD